MFYDIYLNLCKQIRKSPSAVAQELGINKSNVTNWKNNGYTPRGNVLNQIAEYFNVSIDFLLEKEKNDRDVGTAIGSNVIYGDISGDASLSASYSDNIAELNDMEAELLKIFRTLPPRGKHEFMGMIYEIEDKYNHPDLK